MEVNFAVVGDVHSKQDAMYGAALQWEQDNQKAIDAILQVGDFETIRNEADLAHYHAPQKYHKISDFADYFTGEKEAPFLTVFTGGNHEAWGVLAKHNAGGFLAPNVFYLGRSGVINIKGVNVAGLTGVFDRDKYTQPLPEEPCYEWKYYREPDVKRLLDREIDILLLHDWMAPLSEVEISSGENLPESLQRALATPTLDLIQKTHPAHVFMGHRHGASMEARLNGSHLTALNEFNGEATPKSFRVISFDVNE